MGKTRNPNYYTAINIASGLGVLITNIGISFFLSPYIIRTIGVEANGFVTLAQNFVTYADLIVTALNAMAARFITISYVNKDYKKANLYYNSVFWGNLIIVVALLLPASIVISQLEKFVNVPSSILIDVKILFSLIFFTFFLRTGLPNWDCGTYVTNRIYRSSLANMVTSFVRCAILISAFAILNPHVWFVGLASVVASMIYLGTQCVNTHLLTPELKISLVKPKCSLMVIKELVGSGIWSSIAIAGNTMLNGFDLLICNVFLGPTLMGILSISKSIPEILNTFSETIRGSFGPELTISYAKGDKGEVLKCIQRNIKISAVLVTIPTAGIIVMSGDLYKLWIPSQDAKLLQLLTILAVLRYIVCSGVSSVNNVFVTVNKVKYNSFALIITGIISIIVTLFFVIVTDWDLYAVAGISSIILTIKDLVFMIPVSARFLGFKWHQFYPSVFTSILCTCITVVVGFGIRSIIPPHNWVVFFMDCSIIGMVGLIINSRVVLDKEQRGYLLDAFRKKLHIKK